MKLTEALKKLNESAWGDILATAGKIIKASDRQKETAKSLAVPKVSRPNRYLSDDLYFEKNEYFLLNADIEFTVDKSKMNLELVQVRYDTTDKDTALIFDEVVKQIDKMLGSKYQKRPSEFRGIKDVQWFLKGGVLLKGAKK